MTAGPTPPGPPPPGPGPDPGDQPAPPAGPLPPAYDPWAATVEEDFPTDPPHPAPPAPPAPAGQPAASTLPAASVPPAAPVPPGFAPGSAPVTPAAPPTGPLPAAGGYPAQWPGGYPAAYPPATATPGRRGSRTAVKVISIVGALVLLGCVGCAVLVLPGVLEALREPDSTPGANQPTGTSGTTTGTATGAPTGPFAATPAESYPVGEAGITLPDAAPVDGFTTAEVEQALQQVKKGLVAARLDRRMVVDRDPDALLSLLASDARDGIEQDFTEGSFLSYASQVAPGHSLTSDTPRVKGKITFRASEEDEIRLLEVTTNFVWIYPFASESSEPGENLVVVHDEVTWVFPARDDVEPSSRGMWIDAAESYASNIDCKLLESSLLALGEPTLTTGGTGEDDPTMFDPDRSLEIVETC